MPLAPFPNIDPAESPLYGITETAHYVGIPVTTLRYWVRGERDHPPVIDLPNKELPLLSFMNLVEVYILYAVRRKYRISLPKIRTANEFVAKHFGSQHPLAEEGLRTDGIDLFVDECGQLISLGKQGQLVMREVLERHLQRIEYDVGLASKLYPFSRTAGIDDPRIVVIDPRVSFGKPVVKNTGILTSMIAERYKAGEMMSFLARDYDLTEEQVQEAIRYELPIAA